MDPLNDDELKRLLQTWQAPQAPASLSRRVLHRDIPLWRHALSASFRVPVPVAVAAALVIVLLLVYRKPPSRSDVQQQPAQAGVSLAGFEPVRRLEPILITGGQNR